MKKIFTALVLIVLLASCSTMRTTGVVTGDFYSPLLENENVKVILSGEAPEIEVIGMILVVVHHSYYDDIGSVVNEAKEKAASIGANIIILEGKSSTITSIPGTMGSTAATGVHHAGFSGGTTESLKYSFIAGRI